AARRLRSLDRTDTVVGALTPYRIDIVQGNVITREQAALIRPGLSRLQVRDVLGTPLIADPFHAQRWDYIFTLRRAGTDARVQNAVHIARLGHRETTRSPGASRHDDRDLALERHQFLEHAGVAPEPLERRERVLARCHARLALAVVAEATQLEDSRKEFGGRSLDLVHRGRAHPRHDGNVARLHELLLANAILCDLDRVRAAKRGSGRRGMRWSAPGRSRIRW
ncbi:MAG: outer membrane protein assembly factor BamE, partial [Gammaproteobacteria bacterium]|nr:outer membrane protein assembly factor BamE [Gammaproteobacteria bacterium]